MAIGRAISGAMLLLGATAWAAPQTDDAIDWQVGADVAFEQARAQNKPMYLYLEAVWCHWCHVMQRNTLGDPAVAELLNEQVVAVRVDHDAMPDLANRYRAWRWPAQVWLAADGREPANDVPRIAGAPARCRPARGPDPVHVTVVSRTDSAEARRLFRRALEVPGRYPRVEWWNRDRGVLPNPDVTYPDLEKPVAFYCADQHCSLPQFSVAGFESLLAERLGR